MSTLASPFGEDLFILFENIVRNFFDCLCILLIDILFQRFAHALLIQQLQLLVTVCQVLHDQGVDDDLLQVDGACGRGVC